MAVKLSEVNGVSNSTNLKYVADEESEKNDIPAEDKIQGTEVLVIESGKTYRMNSSGEWVQKSGSGGSGLPDYSAANDGDVLAISSGSPAWSAPSGGGILFVEATADHDTGAETLNKTWNEIHAAGFAIVELDKMLCPTIRIKGNSREGFTVVIAYVDELDGTITPYAFYNEDDPDGDLVYTPEEP